VHIIHGRRSIVPSLGRRLRAPVVAIGNFDGVHRGHQALVSAIASLAQADGREATVLTFDPHPARFFAPQLAPPMLMSLERRLDLLTQAGADVVLVEPFTAEFAALSAMDFIETVLRNDLGADHVVVGWDFSFGAKRQGNPTILTSEGTRLGMQITVVPPVMVDGLVCSSTKIREFVLEGRVEGAALLLGRPYETTGPVVHGQHRGRTLGIPTANIASETDLLPNPGVYAAWARALDGGERLPAAVSIGNNPTFVDARGAAPTTVEAHLLDFDGDLYGKRMRLEYVGRVRDQRSFPSAGELVTEIKRDLQRVQEILA
jgi:riboflavin kinase / FMN adenylyltransferase